MRSSRNPQDYRFDPYEPEESEKRRMPVGAKVLIFAAVCVGIYFVCAGTAGKWLADHVVAPVLAVFQPAEETQPQQEIESAATGQSTRLPDLTTQTITLPDLTVYALESGVYEQQGNADADALATSRRGGAGYIYDDRYLRVLVSAYATQEEADSVRETLKTEQNLETWPYTLQADGPSFKITAEERSIAAIESFFAFVADSHARIKDCFFAYDSNQTDASGVDGAMQQLGEELETQKQALAVLAEDDKDIVRAMKDFADELTPLFAKNYSEKSGVEISSDLKYNYIDYSVKYQSFLNSIKNQEAN